MDLVSLFYMFMSFFNFLAGLFLGWWTWGHRPSAPPKETPRWDD